MSRPCARLVIPVIVAAALIAGALPSLADSVVLKGGRMVLGTYHGGGADEIRMTADETHPAYRART